MSFYIAAALLGLSSTAYGQSVSTKEGGITYSVSVPDTTASSGSGDIYIQMSGPSTNSWIGFGQGSSMSGSKMFIIYANAAGTNVTLSPRKGSGHSQPSFDSSAQVTLVEGSGISNGVMTANIKCSDCKDLTSSSSSWIYGALSGSALSSDSQSASISQHSSTYGTMSLDMTKAKNSDNTNPFVTTSGGASTSSGSGASDDCAQAAGESGSATTNNGASATSSGGGDGNPFGSSFTGFPTDRGGRGPFGSRATSGGNDKRAAATPSACVGGGVNSGASILKQNGWANIDTRNRILMSHGIIASLAFVVLFPIGAIAIRLFSFPGLVAFHAACQTVGYLFWIIGFGLGVYIANKMNYINQPHAVIGIILFILAFFQPILGALHHSNYKKFQTRTAASHGHIWLGRILITLGIINGGLGLKLADNSTYGPIVYGIFAAVAWVTYVVAIVIGERRKARSIQSRPPKYDEAMALRSRSESTDATAPQEYYGRRNK
ncbi:iron reductase domain protein [Venturia nashicola]|uniref:Iron reductase domain protein n=1 Tax=Venturia nashicola TaxID=86259 RepID=A0A4Z1PPP4_9PEZI|nr:iron reductase domain protein [Venturia nashicola]TLD36905.1 iron reductase domain protein [Venturia nashicola]